MNLGVTARSLVDSYRTYRSDGRVEPLEEFVASAVAAFRNDYDLNFVLMELDLAEEASSEDRSARRDWLQTVRTTLAARKGESADVRQVRPSGGSWIWCLLQTLLCSVHHLGV